MEHINRFHLDYIDALRSDGNKIDILARGCGANFDIPFEKKIFSIKNAACIIDIRRIIKREKYDAIIVNTSLAAFFTRIAAPKRKRPKIVNFVHGYLFSKDARGIKSAIYLLAELILRNKTDAIITMNEEDRELAEKFRLTNGQIYITRGLGASLPPIATPTDKIRNKYFPKNAFLLVFVGELSKRKNQNFLIKSLKIVKRYIPDAVLCLIGDGNRRAMLIKKANRLKISDSIFFLDSREDACDFMRAADLYVSASRSEGMPFNLIEALGAGKTVLASDIKGHKDLISSGIDGFLYRSQDRRDFVKKVIQIYRGELSPDQKKIGEKYIEYKKDSVFPETYAIINACLGKSTNNRNF